MNSNGSNHDPHIYTESEDPKVYMEPDIENPNKTMEPEENPDKFPEPIPKRWRVGTLVAALSVRALLLLHNILAVWRVVISRQDNRFWALTCTNFLLMVETMLVVMKNGGNEWKWWCPCFLAYLLTTFPSIWLLQLSQHELVVRANNQPINNQTNYAPQSQRIFMTSPNTSDVTAAANLTTTMMTTTEQTTAFVIFNTLDEINNLEDTTWIVIIQESLVYLIVFGRWMLPRANVSRKHLSDLLLEYLAMASDIMELYALFDEDKVQEDLGLTYAILAIWSISFLQFIPILVHKEKKGGKVSTRMLKIRHACGEHFPEVVVTCTSILLQDAPFLCLRLYIIIRLRLVTYSLVFFAVKNIVSNLLLIYRLTVLCVRLPCCYKAQMKLEKVEYVDFAKPVIMLKPKYLVSDERRYQLGAL